MTGSHSADPHLDERAERRFRLLAEAIPQIVWTAGPDGGRDYANRRWAETSGMTPEESLGSGWTDAVHPEDLHAYRREWERAAAEARPFELEYRLRSGGGAYRWFLSRAEPILDDEGRVARWFGTCTDIDDARAAADRKLLENAERLRSDADAARLGHWCSFDVAECRRVERELAESRHRAERIAEVCPVVLSVHDLAEDRPVYFNGEMAAVLGYTREQIAAIGPGTATALMHPDDHARFGAHLDHIRGLADGEVAVFEFRVRHADGSWRWFHSRDAVFRRDVSGAVTQLLGAAVDVTDRRRDDEVLRRNEAEYRSLFEAAGIANAEIALETGRFLRVNRTYSELTGYSADELLGMTFLDLTHADDRGRDGLAPFGTEPQDRFQAEMRYVRKDGAAVWVHLTRTLIRDASGRPVRSLASAHDITERKRAEERLRESELRFRATFENAAVGIAHVAPDGRWLRVNETFCAITGYPREELLARTFQDITDPDDLAADLGHVRRLLAGEATTYALEKRYRRRDGGTVWVNLTVSLVRTAAGMPDFFISVVEDISARRRAEEDVRRLNAELDAKLHELRTILDTAPVGISVARDRACNVIVGNPALAEMLGMAVGENVSRSRDDGGSLPYRILKAGREPAPETLPVQRAAATGRRVEDDPYEVVRADGSRIQIVLRANPVKDDAGTVVGAVGVCLDITALKRAEEALREADRRKDEFLAVLAHELRNPLAAIASAHAVARGVGSPSEDLAWAGEVIDRQLRQLGRLIDDLLDVSRISRGKIRLKRERVEAAAVVARAVESVRGFIDDHWHELRIAVAPEPMPLDADPARLEQVLANLLHNAAKYTDPGGRIDLTAGAEGDEVVIRVRDNGVGISAGMLSTIFDPFAQVEDSMAMSHGGLGIGLTLVRTLTEMHGGRVSAASEGPGRGSEFTVRLPRLTPIPEGDAPPAATPGRGAARPQRPCRILVVDDNADTLRGMSRLLSRLGHEVGTAVDGPSALTAARGHRPEVVVLDIGLPGMSGYDVATTLRGELGPAVVLVAVSGYAQERDRRRSRAAGFDHHLAKPVDMDELRAILDGTAGG